MLANRLSASGKYTVCLLEAGSKDWSPLIHVPAGVPLILPSKHMNWALETVPQKGLNGRRGYQPRGKTLGGSSSINAMLYIRGHRADYDHWAALGNPGWSYDDLLPYFRKSEHNERGGDDYHGTGGPLNVAQPRSPHAYTAKFLEAMAHNQHQLTADFNGAQQEGGSLFQITQKNGRRHSAAMAYLRPAQNRKNLLIITHAHISRVLLSGKKATGIEYIRGNLKHRLTARKEIILSGGAFGSPQMLMLSGIGPEAELKQQGIEVRHALPGVGQNLQDHIDYISNYQRPSWSLYGYSLSMLMRLPWAGLRYLANRRGLFTTTFAEAGAFLKTDPAEEVPDIQLHFVPGLVDNHNRTILWGTGMSCHVCLLRPKSIGHVGLTSPNPLEPPRIDPAFLTHEDDMTRMIKGYKIMRAIMEAPPLNGRHNEDVFGQDMRDDPAIEQELRNRSDSVYHPVGTCKMGVDDRAVVDPELKVRGIQNLRVVDASVMPTLIGGNTNAPTIMIAEKAADMIQAER